MMKIGIITFQRAHNYGAVMQAYALLTTLQNMGHSVEIIDYWPKYRSGHYSLVYFDEKRNIKKRFSAPGLKNFAKEVVSFPLRYRQYQKFKTFIRCNLKVGKNSFHLGSDIPHKYDIIVCGSDQVWRYNFRGNSGFDNVYFAQYPVNKDVTKIAYAASMGDEVIDEHAQRVLSKLLENFDFISVREQSLLELIKPLTNVKPVKVLDPVFLLSETEWRKIIRKNDKKKKYLLFYQLLPSTE
ncbi:MAG: polysaccharide pyruvyl transferase family protein, partial [Ginsengibacter sp.]